MHLHDANQETETVTSLRHWQEAAQQITGQNQFKASLFQNRRQELSLRLVFI